MKKSSCKIIFVFGGTRSGKSDFALKLSNNFSGKKCYLATAEARDEEMTDRISKHRKSRPDEFITVEEARDVEEKIKEIGNNFDLILLDCVTLWLANIFENRSDEEIENTINRLIYNTKNTSATLVVVSNELGMGIVPNNESARRFRDLSGKINQIIAEASSEVYFVAAGLPLKIK